MIDGEELKEIQMEMLVEALQSPPSEREELLLDLQVGAERSRDLLWLTYGSEILSILDLEKENGNDEMTFFSLFQDIGFSKRRIFDEDIPKDIIEIMINYNLVNIITNPRNTTNQISYTMDSIALSELWSWLYDRGQTPFAEKIKIFDPKRVGILIAIAARRGYSPIMLNLELVAKSKLLPNSDFFVIFVDDWYDIHKTFQRAHMGDWYASGAWRDTEKLDDNFISMEVCNKCNKIIIDEKSSSCSDCGAQIREDERGCLDTIYYIKLPDAMVRWSKRVRLRLQQRVRDSRG